MPIILKFIPMQVGQKEGTKGWIVQNGRNTKLHLAVDVHGRPIRAIITEGTQAGQLIEGIDAGYLLADRAYDSDGIIEEALEQRIKPPVIPLCILLYGRVV